MYSINPRMYRSTLNLATPLLHHLFYLFAPNCYSLKHFLILIEFLIEPLLVTFHSAISRGLFSVLYPTPVYSSYYILSCVIFFIRIKKYNTRIAIWSHARGRLPFQRYSTFGIMRANRWKVDIFAVGRWAWRIRRRAPIIPAYLRINDMSQHFLLIGVFHGGKKPHKNKTNK